MCKYYYLHYHHVDRCTRDVNYSLEYDFCENSIVIRAESSPSGHAVNSNARGRASFSSRPFANSYSSSYSAPARGAQGPNSEYLRQPCASLTYSPEYRPSEGTVTDYANPCAAGGCLVSPGCSSGSCRLEDLGGRWVCCRCHRGGNTFRWCAHPMKKVPDTMCYHTVCAGCWADS